MIHPEDLQELSLGDGEQIRMGNERGEIRLNAKAYDGVKRGVVIVEAIPLNARFEDGVGLNTLTGADPVAPFGGAAFHDTAVWLRPAES